jgi:putative transposase
MPRQRRLKSADAYYHVMSRGVAKQNIFLSPSDKLDFIDLLDQTVIRFNWICHSYCLMTNHYHLLLQTPKNNISEGMCFLNGIYCQHFNHKQERVGHLFGSRFYSELVKDDSYFTELLRYIALNPVTDHIVEAPQQYEWSSYRAIAGIVPTPPFLETSLALGLFAADTDQARASYRSFVIDGIEASSVRKALRNRTLSELFKSVDNTKRRNEAIRTAYSECGYRMSHIAKYLGMTCSTISRIISNGT